MLLALVIPLIAFARVTLPGKLLYGILGLLILSAVVNPWYVAWLVVLLPVATRWSAIVFVGAVSLAAVTTLTFVRTGVWEQQPWILALEYLPVFAVLGVEFHWSVSAPHADSRR